MWLDLFALFFLIEIKLKDYTNSRRHQFLIRIKAHAVSYLCSDQALFYSQYSHKILREIGEILKILYQILGNFSLKIRTGSDPPLNYVWSVKTWNVLRYYTTIYTYMAPIRYVQICKNIYVIRKCFANKIGRSCMIYFDKFNRKSE